MATLPTGQRPTNPIQISINQRQDGRFDVRTMSGGSIPDIQRQTVEYAGLENYLNASGRGAKIFLGEMGESYQSQLETLANGIGAKVVKVRH